MWNKIFNAKNPFWQSMDTVFDLFILNVLWVVCCLPIFTIGPATVALFYTLIQRIIGEEGYLRSDFFGSFKRNFKQGVMLGVPFTLVGAFLTFDIYLCHALGKGIFTFFMVFFGVILLLWMFVGLYLFALLAKFDRTNKELLIWAFTLSIKNAPITLLMIGVIAGGMFITAHITGLLFIIFGLLGQFCATMITSVIKPYLPKIEDEFDYADEHFYDFNPGSYSDNLGNGGNVKTKDYMDYDNISDLF